MRKDPPMADVLLPIAHDAQLTEIYVTDRGHRYRVYRGDTAAHIEFKLETHKNHSPEVVIIAPALEDEGEDVAGEDPRDDGLAGV